MRPPPAPDHRGEEPDQPWVFDSEAAAAFPSADAVEAALLPEQLPYFHRALAAAAGHTDDALTAWRRVAWHTVQDPDAQRRLFTAAAEVSRTRRPRAGSLTWEQLRERLATRPAD